MYICNSFWHLNSVHIQFPLQLCYELLMFFDFCLKATENSKKNVQNLSNLYFSNISWNIWTFALQIDIKVQNMKQYIDWMRNFESYCSILARVWIKVQFKQPQINDCSTEEILRLTRGCYFGRLKWKFVIEKEFFSTFALHYLYQG